VIDVSRELRPEPLPEPGQILSAAGPVYRGSYGQRQIEATEVRVGGRPRRARPGPKSPPIYWPLAVIDNRRF